MTNENIRELSLFVLIEVLEKKGYSNQVLKSVLDKYAYLEKRDRAFLTRLCEGTLEQKIRIDDVLDRFSKVPVKKMKPVIRNILRMGVYQLLFMDSVPDSAVCNEAVKLAVKKGFASLKGYVNGVLRAIARNKEEAMLPGGMKEKPTGDGRISYDAIQYAMPQWLVQFWAGQYGIETTEKILQGFTEKRPTWIRCNISKIKPEDLKKSLEAQGITVKISPLLDYAMTIEDYDSIEKIDAFQKGYFQVQDIGSMMVGAIASPEKGDFCLDVCAAPGGKSLHLADLLEDTGMVEARDLTEYKVAKIEENITRCRMKNIKAICHDALCKDDTMLEKADVVIADLPCSGLGVIGRKKDIKEKMTIEGIAELEILQREILKVISQYVKPGGTLLYSTCTINKKENEQMLAWIIEELGFERTDITEVLPKELHRDSMKEGWIQIMPGEICGDGFFISKLIKKGC